MEERQREEGEKAGASPKGTLPSPAGEQRREAQVVFQELGPLPGESLQGHPQVSLTPQVVERILVGVPPGTQHEAPLCLSLLVYPLPS